MKPDSTLLGEHLIAAIDGRDRAVQNLRNAVAISDEDASLDRDGMILDAVQSFTTTNRVLEDRAVAATAFAPPLIDPRGRYVSSPGAPGTEDPLPETPTPGDPTPTEDDPSVPKRDKVPPAQPVQPDPNGNTVTGPDPKAAEAAAARAKGIPDQNVVVDAGEQAAATTENAEQVTGKRTAKAGRAVKDVPQA